MPSYNCRICKRRLKNPLSIKLGIGPVCGAKERKQKEGKQGVFDFMKVQAIEGWDQDIVCSRNENGIETNVPRRIIKHSPDGFEWGYGGSGPADFALNILSVFIGQEEAEKHYQDFKREFIATLPLEGGTIRREDILRWIEGKTQEGKSNEGH